MSFAIDLQNIIGRNDATNFSAQLMRLVFKADWRNRAKLRHEYPNLVRMVEEYQTSGKILGLPDD